MSDIVDTVIDAYVEEANPATNFGTATSLQVLNIHTPGQSGSSERRAYIAIPAGSIPGAYGAVKLWLWQSPGGSRTIHVSRAGSTWAEGTISWSNQPNAILTTGAAIGSFTTAYGWNEIALPSNINLQRGVVLWADSDSATNVIYFSSENGDADHRPYFEFIPSATGLAAGVGTVQINYFDQAIDASALASIWEWFQNKKITVSVDAGFTGTLYVHNLWFDVEYNPLELVKGQKITADVAGMLDGGALVRNPAGVIEKILTDQLSVPAGSIDSTAFAAAETSLGGHDFDFALLQGVDSRELLAALAMQARSRVFAEADKITMNMRPTVFGTPTRTISGSGNTGGVGGSGEIVPLGLDSVKNRIVVKYDLDLNDEGGEPFRKITIAEDANSQADHGVREQIVEAWAIRSAAAAESLKNFLLLTQKDPRELYVRQTGLGNIDLERDAIIAHTDSKWGFVAAVGQLVGITIQPGSAPAKQAGLMTLHTMLEPYSFYWGDSDAGVLFSGENAYFVIDRVVVARLTDAGNLYIRGHVKEDRAQQAATSANPLWHDTARNTICLALDDNTRIMEIDASGNIILVGYYKEDATIAQAGNDNEITSDASFGYININGTRCATVSAAGVLAVAGAIYEDQPDQQLL